MNQLQNHSNNRKAVNALALWFKHEAIFTKKNVFISNLETCKWTLLCATFPYFYNVHVQDMPRV